jgi:hypothetical protein
LTIEDDVEESAFFSNLSKVSSFFVGAVVAYDGWLKRRAKRGVRSGPYRPCHENLADEQEQVSTGQGSHALLLCAMNKKHVGLVSF